MRYLEPPLCWSRTGWPHSPGSCPARSGKSSAELLALRRLIHGSTPIPFQPMLYSFLWRLFWANIKLHSADHRFREQLRYMDLQNWRLAVKHDDWRTMLHWLFQLSWRPEGMLVNWDHLSSHRLWKPESVSNRFCLTSCYMPACALSFWDWRETSPPDPIHTCRSLNRSAILNRSKHAQARFLNSAEFPTS
jgi:hypothetical protein